MKAWLANLCPGQVGSLDPTVIVWTYTVGHMQIVLKKYFVEISFGLLQRFGGRGPFCETLVSHIFYFLLFC